MGSNSKGNEHNGVKMKYIEWLKIPKQKRVSMHALDKTIPKTKSDFADKYGISRVSLFRWEQSPDFQELLRDDKFSLLSAEEFNAMMATWKVEAKTDFKVFKQLVDWAGVLNQSADTTDDAEDSAMFAAMNDDELEAYLKAQEDNE